MRQRKIQKRKVEEKEPKLKKIVSQNKQRKTRMKMQNKFEMRQKDIRFINGQTNIFIIHSEFIKESQNKNKD